MSKSNKGSKAKAMTSHEDIASVLRAAAPEMDDLRKMRLERRLLAATELGVGEGAPQPALATTVIPMKRVLPMPSARVTLGVLALAAAALLGFMLRGGLEESASNTPLEGAHFAVMSADRATEGLLTRGTNVTTHAGERGSIEVGDVTAHLGERTTLSLNSDDLNDVAMRLDSGASEFAFHPHHRGQQHLTVTTPNARVEVVGTVFTVRVDGAGTEVSVTEGTVRVVRLNGGEASLVHAGDTLLVRTVGSSAHAAASPLRANEAVVPTTAETTTVIAEVAVDVAATATALPTAIVSSGVRGAHGEGAVASTTGVAAIAAAPQAMTETATETVAAAEAATVLETATATEAATATATEAASATEAATEAATATAAESEATLALAAPRRPGTPSAAATLASPRVRRAEVVTRGPQLSGPRPDFVHERRVWGHVDDLQSNGQYERSLPLIVEIETNGSPEDRAEALFHHARTLDVALHRPAQAIELYRRYVNTHPDGPRAREAYVRIRMLENQR